MTLSLNNIHKSYGERVILDGVNLSVEPGQINCLIGPSGAGKTTLLRIMAGLEAPDSGTLSCDGAPNVTWPETTVVFQSLFLWPHMTLAENILLPARGRMTETELKTRFEQIVTDFNLQGFVHRFPNEASGGQKQRAALARAVMLKPKYLLMDEITSALDVEQIANILIILEGLKTQGIGMLIITHLLNFAKRMADKVTFLDAGHILEEGSVSLLLQPKTDRLKEFLSLVDLAS